MKNIITAIIAIAAFALSANAQTKVRSIPANEQILSGPTGTELVVTFNQVPTSQKVTSATLKLRISGVEEMQATSYQPDCWGATMTTTSSLMGVSFSQQIYFGACASSQFNTLNIINVEIPLNPSDIVGKGAIRVPVVVNNSVQCGDNVQFSSTKSQCVVSDGQIIYTVQSTSRK